MRLLRIVLGNALVLLALLATCAGVGEVVLRAAPSRNDVVVRDGKEKYRFNPYRPDAALGWAHREHWETVHETDEFSVRVRTGALGLRGGPATLEAKGDAYRVLVLGDSFAFGWGVADDETFAARLAELLPPPEGRSEVEVLNAGVAGWSADHYLVYAREHLARLAPDLVLVVPSENDLSDLAWNRLTLDDAGLPLTTSSTLRMIDRNGRMRYLESGPLALPAWRFPGQAFLAEHSALYHELRYRLARIWLGWTQERVLALREKEYGPAPTGPLAELSHEEIERGLLGDRHFQGRYHEYLMDAVRARARALGAETATLLAVTPGEAPGERSAAAELRARCEASPTCTVSTELLAALPRDEVFFAKDGHWTPRAHDAIARGLAERLAP